MVDPIVEFHNPNISIRKCSLLYATFLIVVEVTFPMSLLSIYVSSLTNSLSIDF